MIALTGDDSEGVRTALKNGGIDDFLTKPVDLALLRKEISRLLAA